MIHLALPDNLIRPLPFYLAMEEWAAQNLPEAEYFFSWRVKPTVIFGRHQRIDSEVDTAYCKANGIEVYRRKSGGGCVFADMHNIMYSYITPDEEVTGTFARYTSMMAKALQDLGLDAKATGRNDIYIGDGKVSGNSFYHLRSRSIVHGTMLYDTDFTHIAKAITPSKSKLESKHVKSVGSHITTLNKHLDMAIEDFDSYMIERMTDSELCLDAEQIAEVEAIAKPYFSNEWIYGRDGSGEITVERRVEGAGEFRASIDLNEGVISDISLSGDFFSEEDEYAMLLDRLKGVRYKAKDIEQALNGTDVSKIITGLSNEEFISTIITQKIQH